MADEIQDDPKALERATFFSNLIKSGEAWPEKEWDEARQAYLQSKVVQFAKQPAPKRTKDMLTRIIEAKQVKPSQFT